MTALTDQWPSLRRTLYRVIMLSVTCTCFFLIGILFTIPVRWMQNVSQLPFICCSKASTSWHSSISTVAACRWSSLAAWRLFDLKTTKSTCSSGHDAFMGIRHRSFHSRCKSHARQRTEPVLSHSRLSSQSVLETQLDDCHATFVNGLMFLLECQQYKAFNS